MFDVAYASTLTNQNGKSNQNGEATGNSFFSIFTLFNSNDFSSAALSSAVVTEVRRELSKLNVGC